MPLSLSARTHRIIHRLQTLEQFLDWAEERGADSPCTGFWAGLGELLHDIGRDVRFLSHAPFPLSEWHGQAWDDFLDEYDQTYDESDLSDSQPDDDELAKPAEPEPRRKSSPSPRSAQLSRPDARHRRRS